MVRILHIETSTKVCSVALSENGVLTNCIESNDDNYAHGEKLTIFIQNILSGAGIKPSDLTAISVTSGPGSYTGLRIGVSVAKGLCYAQDMPLLSINALENLAIIALQKNPEVNVVSMIDARRMEVFSAIFDKDLNLLKPTSADILDEESYRNYEPLLCVGDGSHKMKSVWENRNVVFDDQILCSAKGHVELAYSKFLNKQFEDLAYFEPFYLKDFIFNSNA